MISERPMLISWRHMRNNEMKGNRGDASNNQWHVLNPTLDNLEEKKVIMVKWKNSAVTIKSIRVKPYLHPLNAEIRQDKKKNKGMKLISSRKAQKSNKTNPKQQHLYLTTKSAQKTILTFLIIENQQELNHKDDKC